MFSHLINTDIFLMFVLVLGLTAIIMEVFIPSFGLIGLAGLYLSINGLLAMPGLGNPYTILLVSILLAMIISAILITLFLKNGVNGRFVLNNKVGVKTGLDAKGSLKELEGSPAVVIKTLRPAGIIEINGSEYDAISKGDFINIGENVIVEKVEGSKLYCRRIKWTVILQV